MTDAIAPPVSLEQFAGVTAAIAEGYPLDDVLAQEGIPADVWTVAARTWPKAFAESADLHLELIRKRRVAEDCLVRRLAPLDEDPGAWMGLMNALTQADDQASVTDPLGLTMADVARLGRHWTRKTREDPALSKRLEEAAKTGTLPTSIDAGPRVLRPFPWTPERAEAVDSLSPEALLERGNHPPEVQFASFQLSARAASHQAILRKPVVPGPTEEETQFGGDEPSTPGPVTPFEALEPEAHGLSLMKYAELVVLLQQPGADRASLLAARELDEPTCHSIDEHYRAKCAREPRWAAELARLLAQARQDVLARQQGKWSSTGSSGTEDLPATDYLHAALLPFQARSPGASAPAARQLLAEESTAQADETAQPTPPAPPPPPKPVPEVGTVEVDASAYLAARPLPFRPVDPNPTPSPTDSRPPEPTPSPSERAARAIELASTEEISASDYLSRPATPFAPSSRPGEGSRAEPSAAQAPPAPDLSPEQYAWIVVTFRRTPPERLAETLARFRLTPDSHRLLDATWQARMAADPRLAEQVNAAVRRHLSGA
ncbi:MAG: hypothetical protein U0414_19685 [Polyangiaceae bacterium]